MWQQRLGNSSHALEALLIAALLQLEDIESCKHQIQICISKYYTKVKQYQLIPKDKCVYDICTKKYV